MGPSLVTFDASDWLVSAVSTISGLCTHSCKRHQQRSSKQRSASARTCTSGSLSAPLVLSSSPAALASPASWRRQITFDNRFTAVQSNRVKQNQTVMNLRGGTSLTGRSFLRQWRKQLAMPETTRPRQPASYLSCTPPSQEIWRIQNYAAHGIPFAQRWSQVIW